VLGCCRFVTYESAPQIGYRRLPRNHTIP